MHSLFGKRKRMQIPRVYAMKIPEQTVPFVYETRHNNIYL